MAAVAAEEEVVVGPSVVVVALVVVEVVEVVVGVADKMAMLHCYGQTLEMVRVCLFVEEAGV